MVVTFLALLKEGRKDSFTHSPTNCLSCPCIVPSMYHILDKTHTCTHNKGCEGHCGGNGSTGNNTSPGTCSSSDKTARALQELHDDKKHAAPLSPRRRRTPSWVLLLFCVVLVLLGQFHLNMVCPKQPDNAKLIEYYIHGRGKSNTYMSVYVCNSNRLPVCRWIH